MSTTDPPSESLSEEVVAELQRRIVSGDLPVGSWIRHAAIAEELGVSRTPVREALRILAAQGLVKIELHRGAQVQGQSTSDIRQIAAVRAELEGYAAELAARHIDDAQVARLSSAWSDFEATLAGSDEEQAAAWERANDEFHQVVREAAGNRHLILTIGELRRKLPHNLSFGAYLGNSRLIARNLREHHEIARAIIEQKPQQARRLMAEHIRDSTEAIIQWVERRAGD